MVLAPAALATPSGKKWELGACGASMPCPSNMQCVTNRCQPAFRIATTIQNTGSTVLSGAQQVPYATVTSRMGEAFKNWTADRVNNCETSWGVVFAGTFSSPAGTAAVSANDGSNNVIWLGGAYWRYSATTLGLTTTTFVTATGQIVDADMELNNNLQWSDTGAADTYDYESMVLHEAGHFLGLDHTPNNALSVMFPTVQTGSTKRLLWTTDTGDVCTVYPGDTGAQGTACLSASTCTGSRVCEGAGDGAAKICTANCTSPGDTNCPTGYSCQTSNVGYACLTEPGSSDLCKFCTTGSDCSTGICVTDRSALWCSNSCSSSAQCGTGYTCDDSHFCVPNTSCAMQCSGTDGANCAVGFTCQSGTCRPTGNSGDRCEILGICNTCLACVTDATDDSIAFCRPCCGGQSNGGLCNACVGATCGSQMACVGLANGKDQVCFPSAGAAACQTCSATSPCQTGLTCTSGRCHSACNPFAPANCTACFDMGNGVGQCSCADEVAGAGEPCGQSGTALSACENGLKCVLSPTQFCRVPCTITDTTACRAGETCTNVSGSTVCLPSTMGNQCTACTTGGTCGNNQLSCYSNRCYLTCNINSSGRCSTCVQTDANGNGLCACNVVDVGANCGLPEIASCQPGTLCVESVCRGQCNPRLPMTNCAVGTVCQAYAGSNYCIPPAVTGGGQGGGGGGSAPGGGQGGGGGGLIIPDGGGGGGGTTKEPPICGCSVSFGAQALLLAPLLLLGFMRRRRPVTSK